MMKIVEVTIGHFQPNLGQNRGFSTFDILLFIEHFSTIGQTINERIAPCSKTYAETDTDFSMYLRPTTPT